MNPVFIAVLGALLLLNLISFLLMWHDKQCAKKNQRRVSEKTLFLSAALFGAFGGTLGMKETKTMKKLFAILVSLVLCMVTVSAVAGSMQELREDPDDFRANPDQKYEKIISRIEKASQSNSYHGTVLVATETCRSRTDPSGRSCQPLFS